MSTHPMLTVMMIVGLAASGIAVPIITSAAEADPAADASSTVTAPPKPTLESWQNPDGSWDDGVGADGQRRNTAMCTGLATLVYLGAGYDHQTRNKHRKTVGSGISWLIAAERADGTFPGSLADNGIQAMALFEAFAMTGDPALAEPSARAVDGLLRQRVHPAGQPGLFVWAEPDGRVSTRTNALCISAMKSATAAQLPRASGALAEARAWVEQVWDLVNPSDLDPTTGLAAFPAVADYSSGSARFAGSDPAYALVAAIFSGIAKDGMRSSTLANTVAKLPFADPLDYSEIWMRSLGMFIDRRHWEEWCPHARQMILDRKVATGALSEKSFTATMPIGATVGVTSENASAILALEVYYRSQQVNDHSPNQVKTVTDPPSEPAEVPLPREWK